jgi:hypothetical protein
MYNVELTDTFGGEANYSWVRRAKVASPEWTTFKDWDGNGRREPRAFQRTLMRRAKAAVGLTGIRGRTESYGDTYEFRPYGMCQVMFVTWDYSAD